jgi:hypothetical protein
MLRHETWASALRDDDTGDGVSTRRVHWGRKDRLPEDKLDLVDWTAQEKAMQQANLTWRIWAMKHSWEVCGVVKNMQRWKQLETDA